MYHIYPLNQDLSCKPDKIIVEDTNSGYEYFKAISKEKNIVCESAGGKTKIFAMLEQLKAETESICVIADVLQLARKWMHYIKCLWKKAI